MGNPNEKIVITQAILEDVFELQTLRQCDINELKALGRIPQ